MKTTQPLSIRRHLPVSRNVILSGLCIACCYSYLISQVIDVVPVFPRATDDVTVTFNATEGNGALTGVSPVYAHTGVITSASMAPSDWKHVQGNWGTVDPHVLMQSLGNNQFSISYNIHDFYQINAGEDVQKLAFVFRNADGSVVGRNADGSDIFYPVYPADVAFLSVLLAPQQSSLALFSNEVLPIKGATSQDANLYLIDNDDTLSTAFGQLIQYNLTVTQAGNHNVRFVAVRNGETLVQSFVYTVVVNVTIEDPPAGRQDGLTMLSDTSAYFQLYAPGKSFVHLNGDMSNWELRADFQMKRSVDGNTWWLEVDGLHKDSTYDYQYVVDGTIRIGDPYSTLVLDPSNDNLISAETYPNMPKYPYGKTSGFVSSFVLAPVEATPPLHPKPLKRDLVVYELLVRDFVGAHSYETLKDTLDYLQRMGINAVELMPIQEFAGNENWGYEPIYHMALDKYYGPAEEFRALIEECHARGMAVILDVVFNDASNQSPLALLYWDAVHSRPAANNPWLNTVATHDFSVFNDFNHESPATRYFVKRVLSWWMQTYGVDGFRFDLARGFTQVNTLGNPSANAHFDQSRINILQDYANTVWSIDSNAYVILELFTDNDEETELSSRGMMIWGNMNKPYIQASTGFGGSDLSNAWYKHLGWADPHLIAYMESHDEERVMYKNLTAGNQGPGYNIKDLNIALGRIELVSTFLYMIQGPKMIWQFGELGYDYPINYCTDGTINNNCRLDPKPIRWDYKDVLLRRRIYDISRALISLRSQKAFQEGDMDISLANQFEKKIHIVHPDMDITVVGNFNVGNRVIAPGFTKTGWWYDYLGGDSLLVSDVSMTLPFVPGEYHVFTTKRIPLGFDITTSVDQINLVNEPLMILPTINDGHFDISFPESVHLNGPMEITDISGRPVKYISEQNAGDLQVELVSAVPGMYIVRIYADHLIRWGKVIVTTGP